MRRAEQGSAAVELALMAPLLCALMFFLIHLAELGRTAIAQQQIARYAAWELTARQISDLDEADHERRFRSIAEEVTDETRHRFRDLEPQEREDRPLTAAALRLRSAPGVRIDAAGLGADGTVPEGGAPGAPGKVAGLLGGGLEKALDGLYRFNTRSASARVSVSLEVEDKLLPRTLLPEKLAHRTLAPSTTLLGVDTWYLNDGRDVHLPGGTGGRGSRLYRQVQRMHLFMGALDRLMGSGASAALQGAERLTPVRFITDAQVVSENYTLPGEDPSPMRCDRDSNPEALTGKWKNGDGGSGGGTPADGMSYRKCFDTLPLWANGLGKAYGEDPGYRTLEARGNRYMGCKDDAPNSIPEAGCR